MFKSLKTLILPVLIGAALLALVGVLGSGLWLVREAASVHPVLGWVVAGVLAVGLCLVLVVPVVQALRLPRALVPPGETSGAKWERYVTAYARRLSRNRILAAEYAEFEQLRRTLADPGAAASGRMEEEVEKALRFLDKKAEALITRSAALVFTSTAVSQSGRLDTVIVLSSQLRLVKDVARIYYQRPNLRELWRLYANVGTSGFVAGEIQDSELLAVLGAPVTAGITSFIPVAGTSPLVSLLVTSLLDGSANAFMTLRIGVLTRRYAGLRVEADRSLMARSAALESAGLLGGVVSHGAARVASLTRRLILNKAASGTSRAAKGVMGAGVGLFEKILGMAERAGTRAAESTTGGVRFLQESLRFWETVARSEEESETPAPTR